MMFAKRICELTSGGWIRVVPKKGQRRVWPLRTHLAAFGLILVLPTLLIGAIGLARHGQAEQQAIEKTALDLAAGVSIAAERRLQDMITTLKVLATSPFLEAREFAEFHRRAQRALAHSDMAVILIDRSMQQILNTRVPYGQPLPPTADPATAHAILETGTLKVSDIFFGAVAREWVFDVVVPVGHSGQVTYMLIGTQNARTLIDHVRRPETKSGWVIGISDRNARIVARSQASQMIGKHLPPDIVRNRSGMAGVYRGADESGLEVLSAYVRSDLSGWTTAAFIPVAIAEGPLRRSWIIFVLAVVSAVLLSLLFAGVMARLIARPIDRIRAGARALGRGEQVPAYMSSLQEANDVAEELRIASLERARYEEKLRFLVGELSHRTKNILAVIQAIERQSRIKSRNLQDFHERFSARLSALGSLIDLLVTGDWRGVALSDLVRTQLEPFAEQGGGRLLAEGPPLLVSAEAAQQIGIALHELATNASKYGALSVPDGHVRIAWVSTGPETLRLLWQEIGGPTVAPASEAGFGRMVIEKIVPNALGGTVELDYRPEGLRWVLNLPVRHVLFQGPD